ncbi:MAG: triose-phosphate isomerase [Bacilli bacterium]
MRKNVIVGNWKMNKNKQEIQNFIETVNNTLANTKTVEFGVCAPFVYLDAIEKTGILNIGAQNMHYESSGAYTGEISGEMLVDIGIKYVIIGHSERRQYFNETDETVNLKVKKALHLGLTPIVCCGETLEQYEGKQTKEIVSHQMKEAFKGVDSLENVIVAYEPIWAIGTGLSASSDTANEICGYIRGVLKENFNDDVVIQYGGSVKPDNVKEYLEKSDIDGALVGGASIKPEDFINLITNLEN